MQTMGDAIDLTGDGGVIKTIVRKSKIDAVSPTEDFPLVDGMSVPPMLSSQFICVLYSSIKSLIKTQFILDLDLLFSVV